MFAFVTGKIGKALRFSQDSLRHVMRWLDDLDFQRENMKP